MEQETRTKSKVEPTSVVSSSEDLGTSGFDDEHEELERFVQTVPKVELHVHLDGSFDPQQLWSHLQKNPHLLRCFPVSKKLPWYSPDSPPIPLREMVESCQTSIEYQHLCTCRRRYNPLRRSYSEQMKNSQAGKTPPGTLADMLTCFEFFFPLVYDNYELIEHLAEDFVMRQYEQNVVYTEVRYSPHLLSSDPQKAYDAVTRGLRQGCAKLYNDDDDDNNNDKTQPIITINQILCAINFSPQWSNEVVDMAAQHKQNHPCAVVGIDIAAGEDHFTTPALRRGHYDMCQKAKELGINVTIHAGETPNSSQNVQTAIEAYGAKRIGHGYHIADNSQILQLVKSRNIHLEVCPTSSVETGGWVKPPFTETLSPWTKHPLAVFRQQGLKMSISSDDPAVFNTSLTWQYRIALKKIGLEVDEIMSILEDTISATFLPENEKQRLRQIVKDYNAKNNPTLVNGHSRVFNDRVHYE